MKIPAFLRDSAIAKFKILSYGLRVTDIAEKQVAAHKPAIKARSGVSGGIDVVLPGDLFVNCPTGGPAKDSPVVLDYDQNLGLVLKEDQKIILRDIQLQPVPAYYGLSTSDGTSMRMIGQYCSGDRLCIGITGPYCRFWNQSLRCRYCSIGFNKSRDLPQKNHEQILETVQAALMDPVLPAKHILLGGGTPNTEDMGAVKAAYLAERIKMAFDVSIYTMICPPLSDDYLIMLRDSGVDELGMNLEIFEESLWPKYIPGKHAVIGRDRYLSALQLAVKLFGRINTRSVLLVGIESPENTLKGVELLSSMGIMPILSPFRPLEGAMMENYRGFDHDMLWDVFEEAVSIASKYEMPIGPTCIPCQNNTLALPLNNSQYRFY